MSGFSRGTGRGPSQLKERFLVHGDRLDRWVQMQAHPSCNLAGASIFEKIAFPLGFGGRRSMCAVRSGTPLHQAQEGHPSRLSKLTNAQIPARSWPKVA